MYIKHTSLKESSIISVDAKLDSVTVTPFVYFRAVRE